MDLKKPMIECERSVDHDWANNGTFDTNNGNLAVVCSEKNLQEYSKECQKADALHVHGSSFFRDFRYRFYYWWINSAFLISLGVI